MDHALAQAAAAQQSGPRTSLSFISGVIGDDVVNVKSALAAKPSAKSTVKSGCPSA
jgi:hypothetical protein